MINGFELQRMNRLCLGTRFIGFALTVVSGVGVTFAQDPPSSESTGAAALIESEKSIDNVADQVEVQPTNSDDEIRDRLVGIFDATKYYEPIDVRVEDGVVFLKGVAETPDAIDFAGDLASNTTDVTAVVNDLEVRRRSALDFSSAWKRIGELIDATVLLLPLLLVAGLTIGLSILVAKFVAWWVDKVLGGRMGSELLRGVLRSVVAVLVMVIGVYIALRISGLTRLAVTLLGGTGLVGLALGFAFRDIAENYLASILISLNRPFSVGDLIRVEGGGDGCKGFVRRVTTRGTLLLTPDGNHVQIPNSTVYKSIITNFTASPQSRRDFIIGIGYDDPIERAQTIVHRACVEHPAVLERPQTMVLVESLGASTVNLKVMFWIDIENYDPLKVSSSLMRQVKTVLSEAGISMPDEAREVIFPAGVPVRMLETANATADRNVRPVDRDVAEPAADAGDEPDKDVSMHTPADGPERSPHRSLERDSAALIEAEGGLQNTQAEIEATSEEGVFEQQTSILE